MNGDVYLCAGWTWAGFRVAQGSSMASAIRFRSPLWESKGPADAFFVETRLLRSIQDLPDAGDEVGIVAVVEDRFSGFLPGEPIHGGAVERHAEAGTLRQGEAAVPDGEHG